VNKAIGFGMKIWNTTKLSSILERCLVSTSTTIDTSKSASALTPSINSHYRPLSRLLQSERFHGTSERDPTQKRHDFQYFSRSSYFVLVEDLRQELATVAALEYAISKNPDGKIKPTWPVLYCHPQTRGPFLKFDEREKRRWERSRITEECQLDGTEMVGPPVSRPNARKCGDLRRSVSMNNLHRQATHHDTTMHGMVDLDADNPDSANASGYLASVGTGGTYMAASGNSVGITSTIGTTSNAETSLRKLQLPAALRGRIQQQVITSRKYRSAVPPKDSSARQTTNAMGPPDLIPQRQSLLRKSRSTNTLRLPKREEGSKPGYCENCRIKFDDFNNVSGWYH
jgi:regulatory subunit for Cdc7p protein kinase